MGVGDFPSIVSKLPEADLPHQGWRGWLLQNDKGLVLFSEAITEVQLPEHIHGNQWGVVIAGRIEIVLGTETRTHNPGDTYFIPMGAKHRVKMYAGFRGMDLFAERNCFKAKLRAGVRQPLKPPSTVSTGRR